MLLEAFLFGLTIAMAVGPIALLILNASLNKGVLAGLSCGVGAAAADFTFAIFAFWAGTGVLTLLETNRETISLIGALILCTLGIRVAIMAVRAKRHQLTLQAPRSPGFLGTYALTLTNPLTVLFFAAWLGSVRLTPTGLEVLALSGAIFAGSLIIQVGFALGGGTLRHWLQPSFLFVANLLSGLGIVGFGILQLLRA